MPEFSLDPEGFGNRLFLWHRPARSLCGSNRRFVEHGADGGEVAVDDVLFDRWPHVEYRSLPRR